MSVIFVRFYQNQNMWTSFSNPPSEYDISLKSVRRESLCAMLNGQAADMTKENQVAFRNYLQTHPLTTIKQHKGGSEPRVVSVSAALLRAVI